MVRNNAFFAIAAIMAGAGARVNAAELQRATANAWQEYVRRAGTRMQARLDGSRPFLWADEASERGRRLRLAEILVAPLIGCGTRTVPSGLIHDWISAVFIPDARIAGVLGVIHDYNRYKDIYTPVVTDSRMLTSGSFG